MKKLLPLLVLLPSIAFGQYAVQFNFGDFTGNPTAVSRFGLYPVSIPPTNIFGQINTVKPFVTNTSAGSVTVSNIGWGIYRSELYSFGYPVTTNWFSFPNTNAGAVINASQFMSGWSAYPVIKLTSDGSVILTPANGVGIVNLSVPGGGGGGSNGVNVAASPTVGITTNGFLITPYVQGTLTNNTSGNAATAGVASSALTATHASLADTASLASQATHATNADNWLGIAVSNSYNGSFTGNAANLTNYPLVLTNVAGLVPPPGYLRLGWFLMTDPVTGLVMWEQFSPGSPTFNTIGSGANGSAHMTITTGAALDTSGGGTITATTASTVNANGVVGGATGGQLNQNTIVTNSASGSVDDGFIPMATGPTFKLTTNLPSLMVTNLSAGSLGMVGGSPLTTPQLYWTNSTENAGNWGYLITTPTNDLAIHIGTNFGGGFNTNTWLEGNGSESNYLSLNNASGQRVFGLYTNGALILGTNRQGVLDTSGNFTIAGQFNGSGAGLTGIGAGNFAAQPAHTLLGNQNLGTAQPSFGFTWAALDDIGTSQFGFAIRTASGWTNSLAAGGPNAALSFGAAYYGLDSQLTNAAGVSINWAEQTGSATLSNLNSGATTITIAGTANQITSSAGAQDLTASRTWTLNFPADLRAPTALTAPSFTNTATTAGGVVYADANKKEVSTAAAPADGWFVGSTSSVPTFTLNAGQLTNLTGGNVVGAVATATAATTATTATYVNGNGAALTNDVAGTNIAAAWQGKFSGNGTGITNINAGVLTGYVYTVNYPGSAFWPADVATGFTQPAMYTNLSAGFNFSTNIQSSATESVIAYSISQTASNRWKLIDEIPQYYGGGAITCAVYVVSGTNQALKVTNVWATAACTLDAAYGTAQIQTNNLPITTSYCETNWTWPNGITIGGSPKPKKMFLLKLENWGGSGYWTGTNNSWLAGFSITWPLTNAPLSGQVVP